MHQRQSKCDNIDFQCEQVKIEISTENSELHTLAGTGQDCETDEYKWQSPEQPPTSASVAFYA